MQNTGWVVCVGGCGPGNGREAFFLQSFPVPKLHLPAALLCSVTTLLCQIGLPPFHALAVVAVDSPRGLDPIAAAAAGEAGKCTRLLLTISPQVELDLDTSVSACAAAPRSDVLLLGD